MPEYQPFRSINQPKPTTFNLMKIDTRPDKGWDFDDMLKDKKQGLSQQGGSYETPEDIQKQIKAEKQLARELSGLTSGAKFLSTEAKLDMELTGTRFNKERYKEDSYVSKEQMKAMLPGGNLAVTAAAAEEIKKKKKIESDSDEDEEEDSEVRKDGVDNTFVHNASLYSRLDQKNPFKKGAATQRQQFDEHFSDMDSGFMSGLSSLKTDRPGLYAKMNERIGGIVDRYSHRSIQNVNDPYFNDIDSFDLNMDWYDVFTSPEVFNTLTHEERFFVVMSTYEDSMRYRTISANMFGSGVDSASGLEVLNREKPITIPGAIMPEAEDAPAVTVAPEVIDGEEAVAPAPFDPTADSRMTEERSMAAAEKWWDAVGDHIDNPGKLMAAGLVPAMVDSISDVMDWGNLKIPEDKIEAFNDPRRVFVEGYFKHFDREFSNDFKSEKRVNAAMFLQEDLEQADATYNILVSKRYITKDGRITPLFDYDNPDFEFDLGLSEERESQAYNVLMKNLLGEFNFDIQDRSYELGGEKRGIKIKDSQGKMIDLEDLISKVGEGRTWEDKLDNARNVYDTVLSLYMSMTGMTATNSSNGKVQATPFSVVDEEGATGTASQVKIAMHSEASWMEWNEQKYASEVMGDDGSPATIFEGGWDEKTGEPLVMTFSGENAAQAFADKLLSLTQYLAPMLGMFSQKDLKVLATDQLGLNAGSEKTYKLMEIQPFNSDVYKGSHEFITNKIGSKIGIQVVDRAQVNRLLRGMHKRKKDRYWEAKEEHNQNEYHRLVNEYKKIRERRKDRKRGLMKRRVAYMKLQKQIKKQEMERKAARNRQKANMLKSKRRSQKQSAQSANKAKGA